MHFNLIAVYLLLVFTASAFLMPVSLSSNTFSETEQGFDDVLPRRQLLALSPLIRRGRGRLSRVFPSHARGGRTWHKATAPAAVPVQAAAAVAPGNTAPWAGTDPIADKLWPPGCHLWSLDAQSMQVTSDDGVSKKFLRSLGAASTFPDGYFSLSDKSDGLQIGLAGLALQTGYALDVWIKGSFSQPRTYVLAQGNRHGRPDKNGATWAPAWYMGIDGASKAFRVYTVAKRTLLPTATGLNVRLLSPHEWHRLTIVSLPHRARRSRLPMSILRVFINGTEHGAGVAVPTMSSVLMLGNGGNVDYFMTMPWEGMSGVRVCTLVSVQEQMAPEQAIHNNAMQLLTLTKKWESAWASLLRGRSVILVGNSAKILTGTPHGSFIDTHDVVFRFNALQAAPSSHVYLGRKTTFLVLGDLTQLCNCHDGACCNGNHALALMRTLGGSPGVTVMWARKDPVPLGFKVGVLRVSGTKFVSIHPQKHFEEAFNEYLDSLAVAHPNITHRFPPIMPFRTGFRIIAALLFNQVEFGMVGFDLNEERNALYNGKVTSGAEGHYVAETRVLYDLAQAGLFKTY